MNISAISFAPLKNQGRNTSRNTAKNIFNNQSAATFEGIKKLSGNPNKDELRLSRTSAPKIKTPHQIKTMLDEAKQTQKRMMKTCDNIIMKTELINLLNKETDKRPNFKLPNGDFIATVNSDNPDNKAYKTVNIYAKDSSLKMSVDFIRDEDFGEYFEYREYREDGKTNVLRRTTQAFDESGYDFIYEEGLKEFDSEEQEAKIFRFLYKPEGKSNKSVEKRLLLEDIKSPVLYQENYETSVYGMKYKIKNVLCLDENGINEFYIKNDKGYQSFMYSPEVFENVFEVHPEIGYTNSTTDYKVTYGADKEPRVVEKNISNWLIKTKEYVSSTYSNEQEWVLENGKWKMKKAK